MDKKGESLSFQVIIIAVIALLVLVIVVFLLARSSGDFNKGSACPKAGGRCVESGTCDPDKKIAGTDLCSSSAHECCGIVPVK
jgi:hypothetical protein